LMTSAPRSPRYCAQSGPARTFERSSTLMPSSGLATIASPLVQSDGKHAAEIGRKTLLRDQHVVGGAPFRLVEFGAPRRGRRIRGREPRPQQLLAPGLRLIVMPIDAARNAAVKARLALPFDAEAGSRKSLGKLLPRFGLGTQRFRDSAHGFHDLRIESF